MVLKLESDINDETKEQTLFLSIQKPPILNQETGEIDLEHV